MRAVVQRVSGASVTVNSETVGRIREGLLVLLGVNISDTESNADKMVEKVLNLRIFNDENDKMNLSCMDVKGDALVISQFTLYGDCRKGRRPSYTDAAAPETAERLYDYFVSKMKEHSLKVETGIFGAMMSVSLVNEGPVTIIIETESAMKHLLHTGIVVFAVLCVFPAAFAVRDVVSPPENPSGLQSVQSYLKNYHVVSTDLQMAAYHAKVAEDVRKLVAQYLGDSGTYRIKTFLTIRPEDPAGDGIERWRVSILHGISSGATGRLLKNRIEYTVKYYVVYYYLMDVAATGAVIQGRQVREDQIPLWMCAGILENLTREDRDAQRQYMVTSLAEGRYIPLEDLFKHNGRFNGEKERAAYFHQCGSVIDYLTTLDKGKDKIVDALKSLWRHDDPAIALLWQFKQDFKSVEELQAKWIEFTKSRSGKYFNFQRYSTEETLARLETVLSVRLVTLDEQTIQENIVDTDFEGLMDHDDKLTRTNIAMKKVSELYDLKLRAPKEFQEVIGEYILAADSIAKSKKRDFKKHYKQANKLLEQLEGK